MLSVECDVPHKLTFFKEHLGPSHVWCLAGGSGMHEDEVLSPVPLILFLVLRADTV